jgi:GTP1/Obg family GTP-binding protein
LEAGKDWVAKAKNAETSRAANEAKQEGVEALLTLYQQLAAEPVSGIVEIQRSLRSTPVIKLDTPAVVLVGVPNVGYVDLFLDSTSNNSINCCRFALVESLPL